MENIPVADSYYAVLVRVTGTLTALQADYNNFTLTKQIPSLNIQTKMKPPLPIPNKQITLAKHEYPTQPQKRKENITCVLCGDSHLAHRCLLTCKIRDQELVPPSYFCIKHCGKRDEACKDKCYLFKKFNGSIIDLTCGQKDHGLCHFLLCDKKLC